ncbi:MAG TPA: hypothetical protein VF458_09215 [Ktedonobacteraceae bacterium]
MFDPRDPYERLWWHYDSRRPLSVAQIVALGSVDVYTASLVWLLLENGSSLTVAGPTDPQPGIGKTTTLNALLQFLPESTALAYMSGMYEDFAFMRLPDIEPAKTYALCNEVSDHLPIYMWSRTAQRFLKLPAQGYHVATSVHADTIAEVVQMYQRSLRVPVEDVRRLGLVINIGLTGRVYPLRRRWFTTHFIKPVVDPTCPDKVIPVPLSIWNEVEDTFEHAAPAVMDDLARWIGMTPARFAQALQMRINCLTEFSQGQGLNIQDMADAIELARLDDSSTTNS